MAKYNVAVLGCGAIFSRHLAAIIANQEDYNLCGVYDLDEMVSQHWQTELTNIKHYADEEEVYQDNQVNFVAILTPSHLHFEQAVKAITNGKSVLIEKPVTFNPEQIIELEELARRYKVNAFCVLQVRLNQSISITKKIIDDGLLGEIRGVSLVQRWQRPIAYFSGWRGEYETCGGVLYEFGIHYLDIMQYLLGVPKIAATKFYKNKFKDIEISDTVHALLEYDGYGTTLEISLAAEPRNIELSLTIMGSQGYLKLGGKSLDQIVEIDFINTENMARYKQICSEILGVAIENQVAIGACPHHPELYKQLILNPQRFAVHNTYNVIKLVDEINRLDS